MPNITDTPLLLMHLLSILFFYFINIYYDLCTGKVGTIIINIF